MDDFPLTPFLDSLAADGIRVSLSDYDRIGLALRSNAPWSLAYLRGVLLALLVHDSEQEDLFLDRFNSFFSQALSAEKSFSEIDLEHALDDLRTLSSRPASPLARPKTFTQVTPKKRVIISKPPLWRRVGFSRWARLLMASLTTVLILLGLWSIWVLVRTGEVLPVAIPDSSLPTQLSLSTPFITTIGTPLQMALSRSWKDILSVIGLLLIPTLAFILYQRLADKMDADEAPEWDPSEPRHFSLKKIGGEPQPQLDEATLERMADSLSYFQSDRLSQTLNVKASIEATVGEGGLPTLIFHKLKSIRSVYILEDVQAEALVWNSVARELNQGLSLRGIPVVYGEFRGSPEQFFTQDGAAHWLADLEDRRSDHLLLIFSDGKGLRRQDFFLLESLARWPNIAWLELREQDFWDESTALIARYGIPLYPATAEGLLRVAGHFLTEEGREKDLSARAHNWLGVPARVGSDLGAYIEELLGDALRWAQACSMLQPITLGMADSLRLRFLPHLPPERIDRLLNLPGTSRTVAGLRFPSPVLAILRSGFSIRWKEHEQEAILRFILRKIEEVEPPELDSLAHISWEWVLERVRLELEPERALTRLTQLHRTPLKGAIRAELENISLPGEKQAQSDAQGPAPIPLRLRPKTRDALEQLSRLAPLVPKPGLSGLVDKMKNAWQRWVIAAELLREQARKSWDKLRRKDKILEGTPLLHVRPKSLELKFARANRKYVRRIRVSNIGGGRLSGTVLAGEGWIVPQTTELSTNNQRLKILIDTKGRAPGQHAGSLSLFTNGGNREIQVKLNILMSWKERYLAGYRKFTTLVNNRSAVVALSMAFSAALILAILPPNWINRLYNKPPVLETITAEYGHTLGKFPVALRAYAQDPDGGSINYQWADDQGRIVFLDQTALVDTSGINGPTLLNVNLELRDERGGVSAYQTIVSLTPGRDSVPQPSPSQLVIDNPNINMNNNQATNTNQRGNGNVNGNTNGGDNNDAPPRILYFTANPTTINAGQQVTLCWQVQNDTRTTLSSYAYGDRAMIMEIIHPNERCLNYELYKTTDFRLSVYNSGGVSITKEITVNVIDNSRCTPLTLTILTISPEPGYRLEVSVTSACPPKTELEWSLTYDLFKIVDGRSVKVINSSYPAATEGEIVEMKTLAMAGASSSFMDKTGAIVFPALKELGSSSNPTPAQRLELLNAIKASLK